MSAVTFPPDFLWGAATSAYQIEGSPLADGAGASIWHRFSHTAGRITTNENGDIACDHYRRFAEDVRLMRELGLRAYRFSISWSRVFPEGTGKVNAAGVDFYSRLVDKLLDHEIEPMATLYHWDLPQAIENRGGWSVPDAPRWFADYAGTLFRALHDRIQLWATINEPWVIVNEGYVEGRHAPGRRNLQEAARVAKNLLLAHAAAVDAYRTIGSGKIGLVVNLIPIYPASHSAENRQAAERADAYLNQQFLEPVLKGSLPAALPQPFRDVWTDADLQRVKSKIDFLGINYYLRWIVADDPNGGPMQAAILLPPNCVRTATGWEVFPTGLQEILQWCQSRYGNLPLYITENGAAFADVLQQDRTINDRDRVKYLAEHLKAARQALEAGIDLRGYFVWSLLDNFEWQSGYSKRFGIVHVDFASQRRTPKASARFYSNVIRTNGAVLEN